MPFECAHRDWPMDTGLGMDLTDDDFLYKTGVVNSGSM